jgi:hypothetical protein
LKRTHLAFLYLFLTAALCTAQDISQSQSSDLNCIPDPEQRNSSLTVASYSSDPALPDAPTPQQSSSPDQPEASSPSSPGDGRQSDAKTAPPPASTAAPVKGPIAGQEQPKRILGIMPNYRAVSAGAIPPPPTPRQALKIATLNSFDYSSYIFVGITSLLAEATDAHPQLGKGVKGFGEYYWRGFLDKTDGNYLVIFALPTILHQDERYFAKGQGGVWKRGIYAASRILITPNYNGNETFNASEIFGRGIAQGISLAYYPSGTRTASALSQKYAYALGRDALTNVFREFWPDIATHVLHRHP